jgi:hypothetical protein
MQAQFDDETILLEVGYYRDNALRANYKYWRFRDVKK